MIDVYTVLLVELQCISECIPANHGPRMCLRYDSHLLQSEVLKQS